MHGGGPRPENRKAQETRNAGMGMETRMDSDYSAPTDFRKVTSGPASKMRLQGL